ncbi:hypothetical protein [Afipia sp. P52-10]|uniref:hypothetical protein n=1 Tax=Afipia sp. P52-10 TaxID=1429916 RepID=UPI0004B1538F|nr:hypothetical protein [Afipia sp. P52-10]
MILQQTDRTLTLIFERTDWQRLSGTLYGFGMAALGALLLYLAVRVLVVMPNTSALALVALFIAGAALAGFNAVTTLLEADCRTDFDLIARKIVLTKTGLFSRRHGPVPFEEVTELSAREGFIGSGRMLIAGLQLRNGIQWRIGYDVIWVRPASISNIPDLLQRVRLVTGLPGIDLR